ncbi:MAG: patatin-like phospholipase family protein [Alcanivoracaceae bacterium]|nr:patatin-like phospholipase family protein [Alcanivoracaceae bacterium]
MRISQPQDVEYLSMEGGGGKGVTYLGAVRALEQLNVLPIDINRPGQNQIKGISGSSAGAITALMLAMGLNSTELERILSNSSTFTGFFDDPSPGLYRTVTRGNAAEMRHDAPSGSSVMEFISARRSSIAGWSNIAGLFASLARSGAFGPVSNPMIAKLVRDPEGYLYNLVFDRGLFPGFAARRFLTGAVAGYLSRRIMQMTGGVIVSGAGQLNFTQFFQLTGVDLVITGANVTTNRPAVFSKRHTPNFPVAEAVGISMNLPFIFKPVHVEADVPVGRFNQNANDYHGLWVDGGILNNFPLHAFDFLGSAVSTSYPDLRPLHPNMLGLRLTEGPNAHASSSSTSGTFSVLLEHLGNIVNTVLYPSEQGQIRTPDEAEQSIDLYTYDLETTNFAPTAAQSQTPIQEAERAVLRYFGGP